MATPAINVNDGKHKLIVAEEGERVLTPEQNKSWEMGHKNARKEPMKARIYDGGGNVPAAPDVSGLPMSTNIGQVDSMSTQTPQGPPKEKSKKDPSAAIANMPSQEDSATHYESPLMNQLYDEGGMVMGKEQPSNVPTKPNPDRQDLYDEGGVVQPGVGDRIAARAQQLLNQGKTLATPLDNEAEGFKQKQQMVDQATTPQPKTPEPNYAPVESDKINPSARYGMGKGEQRLDPQGNALNPTTPQGMGASGPQRPVPSALMGKGIAYDCGGMVYDDGGIVDRVKKNLGGDVSTEDQHTDAEKQAAIAQATKEVTGQGAPVDFPGMVMPNPKGIKVQSDTDQPEHEQQRLPNGVTMKDGVYRGDDRMGKFTGDTKMDMSNPPQAEMSGEPKVQEASAKQPMMPSTAMGKPSPMTPIEQPKGNGTTDVPAEGGLPVMGEQRQNQTKVATPDMLSPEMAMVKQDQKAAMLKGKDGLADLGTAKIHERMLKAGMGGEPTIPEPKAPTKKESQANERQKVVQQEEQLRNTMLHGATEQERFQAEKDLAELKRRTPWGSEGSSHPGIGGKLAHAVSTVAQGIGQGIAPYAVNAIPGSRADIARQEGIGEKGVEQAQREQQQAAVTKEAEQKPELQQEQQRITEEKNKLQHDAQLRQRGYKTDATGAEVPIPYEELSTHEQGVYDLNQAKGNAQNAIAELKQAQADPESPQSQLTLAKAKAEGEKMDQAGQKLGLDVDKYKAEYLGLDHNNLPLPGVQTTPEGKAIGTKVGAGAKGSKPTANQTMKADLAENVVHNVDEATKLIKANPDLFGKVAGRFTTVAQMTGSNDKAIAQLGLILHNTALATNGIHGLRSAQAIEGTEKELLNKFKNSPEATIAALKENRRSVEDFMKDGGKPLISDPDLVPKGASAEVLDKDGNVTGHVVNNKYVALPKE